jgi:hypothetical protein
MIDFDDFFKQGGCNIMKQKVMTLSILLSFLVLSFLAGSLPGKVFASNSPTSGIWRTVDGTVAYVQVYGDGSGLCMLTEDGYTFTPFLDNAIEKGVFEAGDIPTKGQDLHMHMVFEGLSAKMTLTDVLTGTASTFDLALSMNHMAEPDVQKDGLWLTEETDVPYYIVQHYANGSARLFAGQDAEIWDMFVESSRSAPDFFSGKDPENGQWVFFSFLEEGVGRVQRIWGRPLYSSGVKQAWTVGELALWGAAAVDDPVMGATIDIYGGEGDRILHQEDATGPYGDFYFELNAAQLSRLVEGFRIEVTGGTFMGEPFDGRLIADVQQFAPGDWVEVNDVTTILAAYLEKHPVSVYADAEAALGRYLELPDYITLDWVIETMDYYPVFFSGDNFVKEMEKQLGSVKFDEYIAWVLDEMDQGKTHSFGDPDFSDPFANALSTGDINTNAAGAFAKGLKIFFEVADAVFGVVELVFNIIGENQKGDATTHIINTLGAIQAQMADVKAKVDVIRNAQIKNFFTQQLDTLRELAVPMENHLKELKHLAKNTKLKTKTKQMRADAIATQVQTNYQTYLTRINEKMTLGKTIGQSFTENLLMKIGNLDAGADTAEIDDAFPKFFLKYITLQFQGYYLLSHAMKYINKDPNYNYGGTLFKEFRDDNDKLKAQVEDMVKSAEKYVLNHQSEAFYYKEFPCTDPGLNSGENGTLLQYVDYLAEILAPTYGFVDAANNNYQPNEGALTVRIVFPVYTGGMMVENHQLKGVQQNQNTTWLNDRPDLMFTKENGSATINLNNPAQFTVYDQYSSKIWPKDMTGKDPYGATVYWKIARAKMSTADLDGIYLGDNGGEALKKSNPMIYDGGDSRMRILTYSSTGNLKYGFYSLYQVPTMENSLKTFHGRGVPDSYIWVKQVNPVLTPNDLEVYAGLTSQYQSGKTHDLQMKYTGNNCYTISSTANPYHFFVPNWDPKAYLQGRGAKIYGRLKRGDTDPRWNLFQDPIHKDDTEAIYFRWLPDLNDPTKQMMASGDWGGAYPMYYGVSKSWGVWHPNDLRKLFPKKHGTKWQFD